MKMQTEAFGKWILAGEHAVLRGCPAIVFPVLERSLKLSYEASDAPLSCEFHGESGSELRLLFWGVLEKGLELSGRARHELAGHFEISSSIPVGAGLGASATLCVSIGRWFVWKGWVQEQDLYEFSRQLENLFHGESSGVDIAVAISGQGLYFEREGQRQRLAPRWTPQWYLSSSGKRGVTSECVAKVKELGLKNPETARLIDQDMREAVEMAHEALCLRDEADGIAILEDAIHRARSCFERWDLAGGALGQHMSYLLSRGAVATKPTGSGDGGFALSLWRSAPPEDLKSVLIPLGSAKD